MQAFRRPVYSSLVFKLADPSRFDDVKTRAGERPAPDRRSEARDTCSTRTSPRRWRSSSAISALTLSIIFSIGAIIGAMITMYASVANRTGGDRHLARARFPPRSDARGVPARSDAARDWWAACVGLALASFMQLFTDLDDQFAVVLGARLQLHADARASWSRSLMFALVMGVVGGFLPAMRAARLKIVDALRAA